MKQDDKIGNTMLAAARYEAIRNISDVDKELLFRALAHDSHEVVCWFDYTKGLRYISPNCEQLFGYSAAELQNNPAILDDAIHAEDLYLWQHHRKSAGRASIEVRFITAGGTEEWLEHSCLALVDEDGVLRGRIGSFINISQRRAMQMRTQALALGAEQSPAGIVVTDAEGVILYANQAFYGLKNCALGDLYGRHLELLTQDHCFDPEMWRTIENGYTWEGENVCTTAGSEGNIISLTVTPVLDEHGKLKNILCLAMDITSQRRQEKQLQEQHERLQQLFAKVEKIKLEWERSLDCIDDIIIVIDGDGSIQRINQAIRRYYPYEAKELVGRALEQFLPEGMMEEIIAGEMGEFYDSQIGKWFAWKIFSFQQSTSPGVCSRVVTLNDVTELRQITAELEDAYEKQKSTQSQLIQQEKMASIGQLAAGVAHEINNPVGFVKSNLNSLDKYGRRLKEYILSLEDIVKEIGDEAAVQRMQESRKSQKVGMILDDFNELIEESIDGADRVQVIVQNLKSFSRVDGAGFQWSYLHESLQSSLNIAWNEIKYTCRVDKDYGELPLVFCNQQQLNQVFLNLLVNAAQAIEENGVISLVTRVDGDFAHISITDTGCGMSPEVMQKIFDPFFTTKEVGKGTGLGLSLCYDIIQKHRGRIDVDSTPGKGTTFHIRLPLQPPEGMEGI